MTKAQLVQVLLSIQSASKSLSCGETSNPLLTAYICPQLQAVVYRTEQDTIPSNWTDPEFLDVFLSLLESLAFHEETAENYPSGEALLFFERVWQPLISVVEPPVKVKVHRLQALLLRPCNSKQLLLVSKQFLQEWNTFRSENAASVAQRETSLGDSLDLLGDLYRVGVLGKMVSSELRNMVECLLNLLEAVPLQARTVLQRGVPLLMEALRDADPAVYQHTLANLISYWVALFQRQATHGDHASTRLFDLVLWLTCASRMLPMFLDFCGSSLSHDFGDFLVQSVQRGLVSDDIACTKLAVYLLKRIVDASMHSNTITLQTEYLNGGDASNESHELWTDFFLLMESVVDTSKHLAISVLRKFMEFIPRSHGRLHPSWWLILARSFLNHRDSEVRRQALLRLMEDADPHVLAVLANQAQPFLEILVDAVSDASLFAISPMNLSTCPFGESLELFVCRFLNAIEDEDQRVLVLNNYTQVIVVHNWYLPIIYMSAGLERYSMNGRGRRSWGPREVSYAVSLVESRDILQYARWIMHVFSLRTLFDSAKSTKPVMQKCMLNCALNLIDPSTVSLADIANIISACLPVIVQFKLVECVKDWITQHYPKWAFNLSALVSNCVHSLDPSPLSQIRQESRQIAHLALLLFQDLAVPETALLCLESFLHNLVKLYSRVYLQQTVRVRILAFFVALVQESQKHGLVMGATVLRAIALEGLQEVQSYLEKELCTNGQFTLEDWEWMDLLVEAQEAAIAFAPCAAHALTEYQISILANTSALQTVSDYTKVYRAMKTLAVLPSSNNTSAIATLQKLLALKLGKPLDMDMNVRWNSYSVRLSSARWEAIRIIIEKATAGQLEVAFAEIVDAIANDADVLKQDAFVSLMKAAVSLLNRAPCALFHNVDLVAIVKSAVDSLATDNDPAHVRRNMIKLMMEVAVHPTLLHVYHEDIANLLRYILDQMGGHCVVVGAIVTMLQRSWDIIVDQRMEGMLRMGIYLARYDKGLGNERTHESVVDSKLYPDGPPRFSESHSYPRTVLSLLLSQVSDAEVATLLMNILLEELKQFILLLSDCIPRDGAVSVSKQLVALYADGYSATAKSILEWTVQRLAIRFPEQIMVLLLDALTDLNARASVVTPILCNLRKIIPHLQIFLSVRRTWYRQMFDALSPWQVHHNFSIRAFAHVLFEDLYALCWTNADLKDLVEQDTRLQRVQSFLQTNKDQLKFRKKAEECYQVEAFDPVKDYCLEMMFDVLPKLNETPEEGRIPLDVFRKVLQSWDGRRCEGRVPLSKMDGVPLEMGKFTTFSVYRSVKESKQPTNAADLEDGVQELSVNDNLFQQKMTPWEMLLDADVDVTDLARQLGQGNGGSMPRSELIVIASLLTKAPNLGGLCRTCEIFNASQLVVSDLERLKKDEQFQSLAVTSDRWMPMKEVSRDNVVSYLQELKKDGYAVLGLEQANMSVSLETFSFPKRAALLLGVEQTGIPADLIQYLDTCIEIPQFGRTRSLNVHVSGALCIYEYAKQHVFSKP